MTTPATHRPPLSEVISAARKAGKSAPLQLVTFGLGQEEFGVDILAVQEINRMMDLTRVPQAPADVEGVINLRGKIIPVLDLRKRFSMPITPHGESSRIIVVDVPSETGAPRTLGFIVDRVNEVLRVESSIVEPAPAMVRSSEPCSIDSDYIAGVGKLDTPPRLLILLDLDRLFQHSAEPATTPSGQQPVAQAA